jgi:hypothetical protein
MPLQIEPPELARLLDVAERPRANDWSLRSALTRYAQGEPRRVSNVLELVRRAEAAVNSQLDAIARDGPELWASLTSSGDGNDGVGRLGLVGLLECLVELDRLGDTLAAWAGDPIGPTGDGPSTDDAVDATVADVTARFDRLGIAREEPPQRPPRGGRRRG